MRAAWDRTKGVPEPVAALDRILERESGEPLVDVKEVCPSVVIHRPQVIPFLRKTVAEMLERAAQALPEGYKFGIVECWRPIDRQRRIYEYHWQSAQEAYPGRPYASLKRTVNRFVAPVGRKAPPGHCTGAAVDVFLIGPDGEPVDVSSPFERFEAAPTYAMGLDPEALRHRMMLVETMLSVGFSNCRDEWWHYSWGDAGWAVRTGRPECVYGLVELPLSVYEELENLWIEANKERSNPYLKRAK